jgi:2-polyprenyl-3-methyl-5-hydroxy-6-metoxy-1,4-benzoquinol methylase
MQGGPKEQAEQMVNYLYDNKWEEGRERLKALELIEDGESIRHLETTGIAQGWRCLEIGAGAGSIAKWLCRQVGESGRVIATDIETGFLQGFRRPQLEVRVHDIATDELETNFYDLIHVRHVLMHIHEREKALQKIADAIKPGGWAVIEESDFLTNQAASSNSTDAQFLYHDVMQEIYRVYANNGMDLHFGAKVFHELRSVGMNPVYADGRMRIVPGGSREALFHQLTYRQLMPHVLDLGRIPSEQYENFLMLFNDTTFIYHSRLTISTMARRP